MDKRWKWASAVALMLAVVCAGSARGQGSELGASDTAAIQAQLKAMQDAWNVHDMKAFVSDMTDDVEWVNVVGMRWKGKDQVYKAHQRMHATIFKTRQLHDPEMIEVRGVTPDVAIVTEMMMADPYTSPGGTAVPATKNALTLVFVKRGGRWLITEGHNTVVDEAAAAHDPGK